MGEVEEDYRYFWDWREEKMNQEELKQRLVGFLIEANVTMFPHSVANHLISNGVTIRERGEWVYGDKRVPMGEDGCPVSSAYCSKCGEWLTASDEYYCYGNFCPKCGADMRGVK